MLVFTANPEDYTARGKIITPLKDRIGSEIRTHYPRTREDGMTITAQEAWVDRDQTLRVVVPPYVREIVEAVAFAARADPKVDRRSGVSQRLPITTLENVVSNAERRALSHGELLVVPRVSDVYASLPSLTGKIELEYEGELRGAEDVGRELVRSAIATVFDGYAARADTRPVITWFEGGGTIDLADSTGSAALLHAVQGVDGLARAVAALGLNLKDGEPARASAADFVLEGLCALRKISRTEEGTLLATPSERKPRDPRQDRAVEALMEDDDEAPARGKKKFYN
jgi:magnesium chelatase subunit I